MLINRPHAAPPHRSNAHTMIEIGHKRGFANKMRTEGGESSRRDRDMHPGRHSAIGGAKPDKHQASRDVLLTPFGSPSGIVGEVPELVSKCWSEGSRP